MRRENAEKNTNWGTCHSPGKQRLSDRHRSDAKIAADRSDSEACKTRTLTVPSQHRRCWLDYCSSLSCWWLGDARIEGICSCVTDLVLGEPSGLNTRIVNWVVFFFTTISNNHSSSIHKIRSSKMERSTMQQRRIWFSIEINVLPRDAKWRHWCRSTLPGARRHQAITRINVDFFC